MNSLKIDRYSAIVFALLISCAVWGQQTKTYKESFDVNKDVVIDINTTHTDIEFQTWDKDRVEVEAVFTIDDVTKEEAEKYFESWNFEVKGNSKEIDIRSGGGNPWYVNRSVNNIILDAPDLDFDFEMIEPVMNRVDLEPVFDMIHALPPMPPMPMKNFNFDYEEYKKDGDAYMKKWKKEWAKNFDKKWEAEMEAWSKEMEKRSAEWEKRRKERSEQREKLLEERAKSREKAQRIREQAQALREQAIESKKQVKARIAQERNGARNFYYFSSGDDKNLKVKKRVIIKMPKGTKLNMNIRHGEVKMAQNLKNIKAILSHTSLVAAVIDGKETNIKCSYSPVIVDNWKYGQLKVSHIDNVRLKNVKSLKLSSNSSDVIIGNITANGIINGTFGELKIEKIGDAFTALDITLENTDAILVLPKTAFDLYFTGSNTCIDYPDALKVKVDDNYSTKVVKGYNQSKNSNKSININAKYSKVVMQ